MLVSQNSRKMLSKMITQWNQLVVFPPVVHVRSYRVQNPSTVLFKVQCFRKSTLSQNLKVSRYVLSEAQGALFEYLHSTRSFSFTDAEHISKNSPHFVHDLVARINCDKDVAKSLAKFLRYNPINEFEPFLESLGLHPSEVLPLVPRHMMFLSEDHLMLENFHVLCGYGIPKTNIGRIFKEAREVFEYDPGALVRKLRAYEDLGLSKTTVIKLVSSSPLLLVGGVNGDLVKLLEKLKVIGFTDDWIGSYLNSEKVYDWNRLLEVIQFLEKVGYSNEYICTLLKGNPEILFEGSGRRVKSLLKAVRFLFDIGLEAEDIANIVSSHIELLSSWSMGGTKTVCKELGVKKDDLKQIMKDDPLKVLNLGAKLALKPAASQDSSARLEKTKFLLGLGYIENSDEMMKALKKFRGKGDQLQERFDCLVQAGLDRNVVIDVIRQAPMVLNQSKDVIQKKIDCLRECLGYPLESVIAFPAFLCYDLERINLRFSMYAWLRKKGAAKPMLTLSTILACSEARFVRYFVNVHPEGPQMWESLKKYHLQDKT